MIKNLFLIFAVIAFAGIIYASDAAIESASQFNDNINISSDYTPADPSDMLNWVAIAPPANFPNRLTHATAYDPVNDKIYMIGGNQEGQSGTQLTICQQYNPVTNTWTDKAFKPTAVGWINANYVRGKIYVVGGYDNTSHSVAANEEYNIATNSWSSKSPIPMRRHAYLSVTWHDSLVYIMGGLTDTAGTQMTDVSIYNPFSNTWSTGTALPRPADMGSAAIIGDTIYIASAYDRTAAVAWPNLYKGYINPSNPAQITWIQGPALPTPVGVAGTAAIGTCVYWLGGFANMGAATNACWQYNQTTGAITTSISYPVTIARCSYMVSRTSVSELYVLAGDANGNWSAPNNYYYKFSPPLKDVGISRIVYPRSVCQIDTQLSLTGLVKNYGAIAQSFSVACSIIGHDTVRYTNNQPVTNLAPGDSALVNFAPFTPTVAEYETIIMRTLLPNDTNTENDRKTSVTLIAQFVEDFEANNGGYTPDPTTGAWEWGIPTYVSGPVSAYSGIKCWGTILSGQYPPSANWKLTSGRFVATADNPLFGFMHWRYIESGYDGGNVKISTDSGSTWTIISPVGGYPGIANTSNAGIPGESCYTGTANYWTPAAFVLPVTAGEQFWIRWHFGSDPLLQYPGWYIDDVYYIMQPYASIEEQDINRLTLTALNAPRPNPVINGLAHISFTISDPTKTSLKIYDVSGKVIKTLVNTNLDRGTYNQIWNGTDDHNKNVAEGIYFYTLQTENNSVTRKLVLTR